MIEERTQNMKSNNLLKITGLHVSVGDKEILHGVDLTVNSDETHVLMGPNGTGKSTLGYAITGNPAYTVTEGDIVFGGESIVDMPVNERAKKGIFLSFQNPLEVPGVTLSSFIRSALEQKTKTRLRLWDFKKKLADMYTSQKKTVNKLWHMAYYEDWTLYKRYSEHPEMKKQTATALGVAVNEAQ